MRLSYTKNVWTKIIRLLEWFCIVLINLSNSKLFFVAFRIIDVEELKKNENFIRICKHAQRNCTHMEVEEYIPIFVTLQYCGVSVKSTIIQTILQVLK